MFWNKISDKIIKIPNFSEKMKTKRNTLKYVTPICDPLELVSSSHIKDKLIYLDSCYQKIP